MAVPANIRTSRPFRKLWSHPLLESMIGALDLGENPIPVGWGYRPSGRAAIRDAKESGTKLLVLEDAPVRSMKPGVGRVYGLVADSRGIYYDASGESDLIEALETGAPVGWMRNGPGDPEELLRRFRETKVSKYNWYPGDFLNSPLPDELGVMVIDQTKGDASLAYGGVRDHDFERMIRDALDEHPAEPIYLRAHPDHRYRGKHSCFPPWVFEEPRVKLLPPDLSPATCFGFCTEVYAATSLMGMEGLIHGLPVKTYGWNFYAGWGLTEDRCESPTKPRPRKIDLTGLFEAAYLRYAHYFDPDSGELCGFGRILDHVELQRAVATENAGTRVTVGWTPWKRALAEGFFRSPGNDLRHAKNPGEAVAAGKLLLWGAAPTPGGSAPVIRVEDGFLRSTGLGAKFHRPLSWVLDDQGIYFDPRSPSRLETILETGDFSPDDLADARELLEFLREHRLTKYNVKTRAVDWDRGQAAGRKIILVPGQVEADASIACGSPDIRTNGELLRRVREAEPDAFIIFKAHPDLVAGARHGSLFPGGSHADLTITEGNVLDWIERSDEIHTITSTVGFEALMRGVPVVTYGMPFYGGWGLTIDRMSCPRRTRRLTLDELVCGALIRYPRYLNPDSGEFTTAIQVARILASGTPTGGRRAWYLRLVSMAKHGWVRLARGNPSP